MTRVLFVLIAFSASWVLTALVRRYAVRYSLVDVPNDRSSHSVPTPRGGGLSIVLVSVTGFSALAIAGWLPGEVLWPLILGGLLIALAGWRDDHGHVRAAWRALTQFVAASMAVYAMGGFESLTVGTWVVPLGPAGSILAVLGLVWLTNLFNFMDGIDGLAAGEAVTVAGVAGVVLLLSGNAGLGTAALLLAAAAAGFLVWNWPPARIFMGDVGSGFIGFTLGVFALLGEATGAFPLMLWMLLLGVFVMDASITLARRLLQGSKFYRPHRQHAYQRAVRSGLSHRRVTFAVLLMNAVLGGLALVAFLYPVLTVEAVLLGMALFMGCYVYVERRYPMKVEPPRVIYTPRMQD